MKEECKKDFERMSEYLDGELNDDICREIENHLRHQQFPLTPLKP